MTEPVFQRLALIGIGLIGSSIALAARRANLVRHIAISTRSAETLERASELKLGDSYHADAAEAARDADCVILCIPVGVCGVVTKAIAGSLKPGAIVSDVGSVKASVIAQVQPHLPEGVQFVPAHPVAGTEYSGPDAGFAELFENRWCILTPRPEVDRRAVETMHDFWRHMGANVEVMKFSAGGFRDFTRIAASDPTMWRDVFLNNREAVLEMLGRFMEDLTALQRLIRYGDGDKLFDLFTRTRAIRRGIIAAGQETAAADFGRPHGKGEKTA